MRYFPRVQMFRFERDNTCKGNNIMFSEIATPFSEIENLSFSMAEVSW
jgi:hypothetical protein